jgi:hypothetical protein
LQVIVYGQFCRSERPPFANIHREASSCNATTIVVTIVANLCNPFVLRISNQKIAKMYMRCLRHIARKPAFAYLQAYAARSHSTKPFQPLRILFCGSDDFSVVSLRQLCEEKLQNPQLIESIDVMVRPGKPTGRGLKKIREGCQLSSQTC